MGYRDTIKSLVNNVITSSLGDLSSSLTLRSISATSYSPTTGAVTNSITTYACTGVLTSLKQDDVADASLVTTGRKLLVPSLQLEGVQVDALDDDAVIDGVGYKINQVKLDPAGALFIFVVTAKQGAQIDAD